MKEKGIRTVITSIKNDFLEKYAQIWLFMLLRKQQFRERGDGKEENDLPMQSLKKE